MSEDLPSYFDHDTDEDWFETRCARDFFAWKVAKWFCIVSFVFFAGVAVGVVLGVA